MNINWKTEKTDPKAELPVLLQIISTVAVYGLAIWLGTAVFYAAADGVQGAASGGTNGNIEQLR